MTGGRGSDKHGRLLDEALDRESQSFVDGAPVESRSQDRRSMEAPDDTEPTPDARLRGDRGLTPEGSLSLDEAETRSEMARWIEPSVFPAGRDELLASAHRQGAPDEVLGALSLLPGDAEFSHLEAVWEQLGGRREQRG